MISVAELNVLITRKGIPTGNEKKERKKGRKEGRKEGRMGEGGTRKGSDK